MDNFEKYEQLRLAYQSPAAIYLIAKADRLDFPASIRMLRQVFKLSLVEAKEVTVVATGLATSLSEYQGKFADALEEAFKIAALEDAVSENNQIET